MNTPLTVSFRDIFKSNKALREERAVVTRKIAEKQRKLGSILPGDAEEKTKKDGSGSKADRKVQVVPPKDHPGSTSNSNQTRPNGPLSGKQQGGGENQQPEPEASKPDHESARRRAYTQPLAYLSKTGTTANGTSPSKKPVYVDDNLTLEELLLLNSLATKYEEEKWLRISSRFYDKTGKRITAEKVKSYVERGHG